MSRSRASALAVLLLVTACSGGGGSRGGVATGPSGQSLFLPSQATVAGDTASFDVDGNNSLTVTTDGGLDQTLPVASVEPGTGLVEWATPARNAGALGVLPGSGPDFQHTAFGIWMVSNDPGAFDATLPVDTVDAGAFYGGFRTARDNMPSSGSATYDGAAFAFEHQGTTLVDAMTGTFTANANFGAGTISGQASLLSNDASSWGTINTGTMAINGNGFASAPNGSTSSNGHVGSTSGNFLGPNANEIGGAFDLDNGSTGVKGSFGAIR
jgi:hypothetical protein